MNKNYQKGVRFEREIMALWRDTYKAEYVGRCAGSHSPFDVIVIHKGHPTFIQCKVTVEKAVAERLLRNFRDNPPLPPSKNFHQTLSVKVHGSTEVHSVTI